MHSIQLSLVQRDYFLSQIKEAKVELEEIKKQSDSSKKYLESIENIRSGIYTDFIAILGIFTAITFATFGATSMLSSIFSHINNITFPKMGLIFTIAGIYLICLYALIAVMFVGIHKIIHSEDVNDENGMYEYKFTKKIACSIICFCIGLILLGVGIVRFG